MKRLLLAIILTLAAGKASAETATVAFFYDNGDERIHIKSVSIYVEPDGEGFTAPGGDLPMVNIRARAVHDVDRENGDRIVSSYKLNLRKDAASAYSAARPDILRAQYRRERHREIDGGVLVSDEAEADGEQTFAEFSISAGGAFEVQLACAITGYDCDSDLDATITVE